MTSKPTLLERAYSLARAGDYADMDLLRRKLKSEGYDAVDAHISGSVVVALRKLIKEARLVGGTPTS
ncbi:hypothetical protein [Sphingomonas jatrophae]|uniref:Regulatory protein RecX n=1 Tax=Sphingomonas jatrophae TaxID=1166337 RepID=A0A1I6M8D5_9SPHN|nr:hypothetical protein [Sphingomonas jatrophae]SFS11883.1 hypothetical protein SAMN05192580_3649 [Sphingomonas jatrophae]